MKCMVIALCRNLNAGDAYASAGRMASKWGGWVTSQVRRKEKGDGGVHRPSATDWGTGRGRAEFPMQVQGIGPKAIHQDRHESGRAMAAVAAAAAYMALIAPSATNSGRQIINPYSPTGVLHTPPWPRVQVIEVPPPSRLC